VHHGSHGAARQAPRRPFVSQATVLWYVSSYLLPRARADDDSIDSTGAPRPVVNSKGRRRRPGTKTLAQVLKSDDELFVDFIAKCLDWSPERRLKPEPALRRA
jgi:dual specificity tyrosine-phosphorylation-regulated kinase 2/3/4